MNGVFYLLKYTWKFQKKYIVLSFIHELCLAAVPFANIILPKFIIDELIGEKDLHRLGIYIGLTILSNFIGAVVCTWLRNECFKLKGRLFVDFQEMIAGRLARCDYEKLEDPRFLDIKEKAHKFLYANGQGFGEVMDQAFHILGNLLRFVGIACIVVRLSVLVAALLFLVVLVQTVVEGRLKQRYVDLDLQKAPVERRTNYLIRVLGDFSYGKEVRLLGIADWFGGKIRFYLQKAQDFYKKQLDEISKIQYVSGLANVLEEVAAYAVLVYKIVKGRIGVGDFTMYLSAIGNFRAGMNSLTQSWVNIRQFESYYDALKEYLDVPGTMDCGQRDVPKGPYEIRFDHVFFQYPGQAAWALRDVSLLLEGDGKYSIVGENGAGKTTFIKLLCRLYDPTEGRILLNGVDIREYNYGQYLALFGTVFQDYKLFSFSLYENIVFQDEGKEAEVEKALRGNGLADKLEKLPKGIHTFLHKDFEEDGFEPSGGEGQKIALARAVYMDRPVIVLDEPAAALDPKAEYQMYQNFDHMVEGKLALYISHRMSSARFCDKILLFSEGVVAEEGTHKELMDLGGRYYEMYQMQAEYYQ
nr:ABC transporter ATP-binding protein [uncultured Acetatifactor sp.]